MLIHYSNTNIDRINIIRNRKSFRSGVKVKCIKMKEEKRFKGYFWKRKTSKNLERVKGESTRIWGEKALVEKQAERWIFGETFDGVEEINLELWPGLKGGARICDGLPACVRVVLRC